MHDGRTHAARILDELCAAQRSAGTTDSAVALDLHALVRGDAPQPANDPALRDALLRAAWLLFVAAPRLLPRALTAIPAVLERVEQKQARIVDLSPICAEAAARASADDALALAAILDVEGAALAARVEAELAETRASVDQRLGQLTAQTVGEMLAGLPFLGADEPVVLLLPAGTPEQAVRRAAASVGLVERTVREASLRAPLVVLYADQDGAREATYVHETAPDVRLLRCEGEGAELVARELAAALGAETPVVMQARLAGVSDRDAWVEAAARLGTLLRRDAADDALDAMPAALAHPEAEVRHAALFWSRPGSLSTLTETLAALRDEDPDPRVRHAAALHLGEDAAPPFALTCDQTFERSLVATAPFPRRAIFRRLWDDGFWVHSVEPARRDRPLQAVWVSPDGLFLVLYLEDEAQEVQRVLVRGANAEGLVAALSSTLNLRAADPPLPR
jgi:hypothetical protein